MNQLSFLPPPWAKIEAWRMAYYRVRPHSSLGDATPEAFAGRFETDNPEAGLSPQLA